MRSRPISKISHWLNIVWSTFAEGPHANHLYPRGGRLFHCLGHTHAILVSIHHGDICPDKTKRLAVDLKTAALSLHELAERGMTVCVWLALIKENRRARSQGECGDYKQFLVHQSKALKREDMQHYRGLVNLTNPMIAQNAP